MRKKTTKKTNNKKPIKKIVKKKAVIKIDNKSPNYSRWIDIGTMGIFFLLFAWNLYSPSGSGVFNGEAVAIVDYAATTWIFFTIIFAVLGLNYLLKLFIK